MPPRTISILCSIQTFFIVAGYLVTRAILRIYERFSGGLEVATLEPVEFVRSYGLWCLLVPIAWGFWVLATTRPDRGDSSMTGRQFVVGVAITAVIILLFLFSALYSIAMTFGHHGLR
jgi:hypothetical protein